MELPVMSTAEGRLDQAYNATLTAAECEILELLGQVARKFSSLGNYHPSDPEDFRDAIHQAQRIIACRPARRANPEVLR